MNRIPPVAGRKLQARPPEAGRIGYKAFSWWTMMNVATREPTRSPGARRGWRTLLVDAKS